MNPILKIVFSFSILLTLTSFLNKGPGMKFTCIKHNFGFVHQGDVLVYDYEFVNTGDATLYLYDAKVACHCTDVIEPDSVLPGKTGTIQLKFDSKSATGRQVRTIILSTNASNSPFTLVFKCFVRRNRD